MLRVLSFSIYIESEQKTIATYGAVEVQSAVSPSESFGAGSSVVLEVAVLRKGTKPSNSSGRPTHFFLMVRGVAMDQVVVSFLGGGVPGSQQPHPGL